MKPITQFITEQWTKCKAYLLVGLPGSGKSTWCKENYPDLPVVSRDIIRAELGYTESVDQKAKLSFAEENNVTKEEHKQIKMHCERGKDFIIDDTNINLKFRREMIKMLRDNGAFVVGVQFNTPLDTCIHRREGQIDANIMKTINQKMTKLSDDEVDELIIVQVE